MMVMMVMMVVMMIAFKRKRIKFWEEIQVMGVGVGVGVGVGGVDSLTHKARRAFAWQWVGEMQVWRGGEGDGEGGRVGRVESTVESTDIAVNRRCE